MRRDGPIELSAAERAGAPFPGDAPCCACLSAADPREGALIDGQPVVRCTNPTTCRLRGERAGIWGSPEALMAVAR